MENHAQKVTIAPAGWSAEVEQLLSRAVQYASLPDIRAQVEQGAAQVFTVANEAGDMLAAYAVRVDALVGRNDGVIVAAAGDGGGVNLTATVLPVIEEKFINCSTIRVHTARPGLVKALVQHHGYQVREIVLVKEVNHEVA